MRDEKNLEDAQKEGRGLLTLLESVLRRHLVCHKDREASARGMGPGDHPRFGATVLAIRVRFNLGHCPTGQFFGLAAGSAYRSLRFRQNRTLVLLEETRQTCEIVNESVETRSPRPARVIPQQ
jgi:hypothetical protein